MLRKKMNYKDRFLLLVLFFGFMIIANAQSVTVSGMVTVKSDGLPLPGASIIVVGTKNSTQTDLDGKYVLKNVPKDAELSVSFVGVKNQKIKVQGRSKINISVQYEVGNLDEVVVIGYGSSRKSELTEAVIRVKNSELIKSTGTSIESALQGRVSGVKITTSEGGPGSGLKINVRGTSSINGTSEPLYVIDGVPFQKDVAAGASGGVVSSLPTDPLSGVNPNDIESIEVLKDASATAIYGSRGANGVVLITTKQGKAGKLVVNYDLSSGFDKVSKKLDILSSRDYYKLQYIKNPDDKLFTNTNHPYYVDPNKIAEVPLSIDWQDEVFREAFMQNHQLNFRGGTDKTSFFASMGYLDQEGIIVGSDFNRITGLLNLNVNAEKLRFTAGMNFSQTNQEGSVYASGGPNADFAGVITKVFFARPLGTRDEHDTEYSGIFEEDLGLQNDFTSNPYLFATLVTNENRQSKVSANINTFYELGKKFEIQTRLSGTLTSNESKRYFPTTTNAGKRLNGYAQILNTNSQQFSFEQLLHYKNNWGKHNLKAMAGYTVEKTIRDVLNVENKGFEYDNLGVNAIEVGTDLITPTNFLSDFALNSYFARFNYGYDDKYLLTFTARRDGSSKFPKSNKYANFASASLAWNVHKERFLKNAEWINNFKIRYSLGSSGDQAIPPYSSLDLLGNTSYSFGGGIKTGLVFSQLENSDLRWETSMQNNLGFDLGFFKNKISLTIDAFIKKTSDVLLAIPVSSSLGLDGNPFQNSGSIENRGLEITLNTNNISKRHFNWSTDFNISFNKNTITSLGDVSEFYADFGGGEFSNIMIYRNGGEIGEFYGYQTNGIYKNADDLKNSPVSVTSKIGEWKFKDVNGDGIIDPKDRTVIGSNQPKYFGGLTNNFKFHNFDLSFFLSYSVGQQVYNANRFVLEHPDDNRNKLTTVINESFSPGVYDANGNLISGNPNGTLPAIGSSPVLNPIDHFVEDASYIRLQNFTFGYILPLPEKLNISKIRVYLSGNNLFVFSKYTGYDPDVNTNRNNNLVRGVDFGSYPRSRNILLGLNVTF